jgi:hypothetical protein
MTMQRGPYRDFGWQNKDKLKGALQTALPNAPWDCVVEHLAAGGSLAHHDIQNKMPPQVAALAAVFMTAAGQRAPFVGEMAAKNMVAVIDQNLELPPRAIKSLGKVFKEVVTLRDLAGQQNVPAERIPELIVGMGIDLFFTGSMQGVGGQEKPGAKSLHHKFSDRMGDILNDTHQHADQCLERISDFPLLVHLRPHEIVRSERDVRDLSVEEIQNIRDVMEKGKNPRLGSAIVDRNVIPKNGRFTVIETKPTHLTRAVDKHLDAITTARQFQTHVSLVINGDRERFGALAAKVGHVDKDERLHRDHDLEQSLRRTFDYYTSPAVRGVPAMKMLRSDKVVLAECAAAEAVALAVLVDPTLESRMNLV